MSTKHREQPDVSLYTEIKKMCPRLREMTTKWRNVLDVDGDIVGSAGIPLDGELGELWAPRLAAHRLNRLHFRHVLFYGGAHITVQSA